jgi:hypothetical protein
MSMRAASSSRRNGITAPEILSTEWLNRYDEIKRFKPRGGVRNAISRFVRKMIPR